MHALTITASLLASTLFSTVSAAPQGPPAPVSGQLATYYGQKGVDIDALCADPNVDIVPISFLSYFATATGGFPETNFANNCWASEYYKETKIFDKCHSFVNSIKTCQNNGKKVLLSMGGDARTSDVSLSSPDQAAAVAKQLWAIFGPVSKDYTGPRPFGDSVVDGFDFDVEGKQASANHAVLAQEFRKLFATDASKTYYLSAAPQCGFNDPLKTALATGAFDFVFTQFYNNECHARGFFSKGSFSSTWNQWSSWLQQTSPKTKLFLGLPGAPSGVDQTGKWKDDYLKLDEVKSVVNSVSSSPNFGGLMLWDYSIAAANGNFQAGCKSMLGGPKPPTPSSTTTSTTTTSTTTTSTTTTSTTTTSTTTTSTTTTSTTTTSTSTTTPYVHPTTTTTSSYVHPTTTTTSYVHPTTTTEVPSQSTTTTTWGGNHPSPSEICGAKGYDLNKPAAALVSTKDTIFDACSAYCSKYASFAFSTEQCLCYEAPVKGNFSPDESSPFTYYDAKCAAPGESTTTITQSSTSNGWPSSSPSGTTSETTKPGQPHPTSSSTSAAETSTTIQTYWGDEDFSTTSSTPVSPTETPTWSDATWTSSTPVSPDTTTSTGHPWSDATWTTTTSVPSSPESTTSAWSDYDVSSSTPVSPASSSSSIWSDYSVPAIPTEGPSHPEGRKTRYITETVDVTLTECACTYEPTSTPVAAETTTAANTWSDYSVPAVPTAETTIAVVPVASGKPSSPVSPISGESGSSPVQPFTGAAAEQQLPATVFSVAMCVAVAVAGLFL